MRKYWFIFFIPLLIFPFFGKSAAVGVFYDMNLEFNPTVPPSTNYTIGNFKIDWNNSVGQISISHLDEPTKIIWQSIINKAFCGAAKGNETITEKAGSFTIVDSKTAITQKQKIDNISSNGTTVIISGSFISGANSVNYTLTFSVKSDKQLHLSLTTKDASYNRLYLTYFTSSQEQFFGLGEQPSYFNHKGKRVPILIQEQGIGRGDITNPLIKLVLGASVGDEYTSYKSIPHYISSSSNSLYLENYEYSEFDFTKTDKVQVEVFTNKLEANIIYAKNPLDAIEEYTTYSGRMRALPNWIQEGAVIGMQGGTDKAYRVWKTLKDAGTPISAFWLQDWIGQRTTLVGKQLWWNWELDNQQYPKWNTLVDSLKSNGINMLGYVNPFIVPVAGNKTNFRRDMYKEAKDNNFLVLNPEGSPYLIQNTSFSSAILDLSDTNCVRWIKDIIKDELIARGQSGWMADFAEAMPFDVTLKNGESPMIYHNKYPEEWAKINREAIEEAGFDDSIVFFCRSGSVKSPKYATLFWQGDQLVDWTKNDGFKSAVTGLLSSGLSGFSINHSDIGGYTSIGFLGISLLSRSKELLYRWMEMSAFTPVFRTHEGLGPDKNYQVYQDTATAKHFARNAKIYKAWNFYRKQLIQEATTKGWPVCRHLFLQFPNDANTYNLSFEEFMVGNELLVAPVMNPNTTSISVYLPAGKWENLWTGNVINSTGQTFQINGLNNKAAVFFQQGSAVGNQFKQNLIDAGVF